MKRIGHLAAALALLTTSVGAKEIKLVPYENLQAGPPMQANLDLGSGESGPGFQAGERAIHVTLMPDAEVNDWTGRSSVRLRIYAGGPPDARIVISIFPEGDFGGSYWWTRITADWQGWKELELPLGATDVNQGFKPSNKDGHVLPASFEKVDRLEIRNQWGNDAPDADVWAIPTPSPGLWGLSWIEIP